MRRPGRPRGARRVLLVGAFVAAVGLLTAAPAGAAELTDAGWWWRLQDGPAPLPAPPTVPPGGLLVQGAPDGATACEPG